jgi:hypothetical protein
MVKGETVKIKGVALISGFSKSHKDCILSERHYISQRQFDNVKKNLPCPLTIAFDEKNVLGQVVNLNIEAKGVMTFEAEIDPKMEETVNLLIKLGASSAPSFKANSKAKKQYVAIKNIDLTSISITAQPADVYREFPIERVD